MDLSCMLQEGTALRVHIKWLDETIGDLNQAHNKYMFF